MLPVEALRPFTFARCGAGGSVQQRVTAGKITAVEKADANIPIL
jgi:hypothetical protein